MIVYSDVDAFLTHHGVAGMKWGVRKDRGHVGERVSTRKLAKLDKKWQQNIYSIHGSVAVHNNVADRMNGGVLDKLNNNPKYKNKDVLDIHTGQPLGSVGKSYMKDYEALVLKHTAAAVKEVHGTSPSGMKAHLDTSGSTWKVVVSQGAAQHAAGDWEDLVIEVEHDSRGMILQAAGVKDSMAQSDLVWDFLEHHGVRGMKWGVRKRATSSGPATPSAPHHSTLSNEELKKHIDRMNLEQKYTALTTPKRDNSEAKAFVKGLGKTLLSTAATAVATQQINRVLKKIP